MIEVILVPTQPGKPEAAEIVLPDENVDLFGGALGYAAKAAALFATERQPVYMEPDLQAQAEARQAQERAHFYRVASLRIMDDFSEPMRLRYRAPELYAGLMFGLGRLATEDPRRATLFLRQHAGVSLNSLLAAVRHRILQPAEFENHLQAHPADYDERAFYNEYHYPYVDK